jgi:hypothetical protein
MEAETDVIVSNEGSVFLLNPVTDAGKEWIKENCRTEGWQWLGECLAIEPRYALEIVEGMQGDGLVVQ